VSYNVVTPGATSVLALRSAIVDVCQSRGVTREAVRPDVLERVESGSFTDRDVAYMAALAGVRPSDFLAH
jgi:hypothetical protein